MLMMFNKKTKGFTLIELLVVIGIMSILAAILLPALLRARAHARHGRWMTGIRASNRIDPNCVLFFTFERETISGTEVKNLAEAPGRGRHHLIDSPDGIITGAVEAEGRFPGKTALRFDGNDRVEVPDSAALDITDEITLEAWINSASLATNNNVVGKHNEYMLRISSLALGGRFEFWVRIDGVWRPARSPTPATVNAWYHVVGVWNRALATDNLKLYINGELVDTTTITGSVTPTTNPLEIGELWGSFFNGIICEVAIFDRALTSDEIRTRFEGSRP